MCIHIIIYLRLKKKICVNFYVLFYIQKFILKGKNSFHGDGNSICSLQYHFPRLQYKLIFCSVQFECCVHPIILSQYKAASQDAINKLQNNILMIIDWYL